MLFVLLVESFVLMSLNLCPLILCDIQVKDLIEYCLQLYMNQKEVIQTLEQNAHIEPGFTELGKVYPVVNC